MFSALLPDVNFLAKNVAKEFTYGPMVIATTPHNEQQRRGVSLRSAEINFCWREDWKGAKTANVFARG